MKILKKYRKIKRIVKRIVCAMLSSAVLVGAGSTVAEPVTVQAASTVTIAHFNVMLKEVTGEDAWKNTDSFYNSRAALTNEVAAQMALRADEQLYGSAYDNDLYQQVVEKKRIKDISKAAKTYQKALRICFVKGIMPGKSPGSYSQQRTLSPKSKTTPSEVRTIVKRVKEKTSRIKLTDDGQVTRTKNLPKNAKDYPYILASFPNSYYEPKFEYQLVTYPSGYIPKNLVDYASPKNVMKVTDGWDSGDGYSFKKAFDSYGDEWMETIEQSLMLRFNYNYKTTDFSKWKTELLQTYPERDRNAESGYIDNWKKYAEKYKVITKTAKIVVEPSSIYLGSDGYYHVRCYVKFRVSASKYFAPGSYDQNIYVYSTHANFPGLKLNKDYELVTDIAIGYWVWNSRGQGATVVDDYVGPAGIDKIAP